MSPGFRDGACAHLRTPMEICAGRQKRFEGRHFNAIDQALADPHAAQNSGSIQALRDLFGLSEKCGLDICELGPARDAKQRERMGIFPHRDKKPRKERSALANCTHLRPAAFNCSCPRAGYATTATKLFTAAANGRPLIELRLLAAGESWPASCLRRHLACNWEWSRTPRCRNLPPKYQGCAIEC